MPAGWLQQAVRLKNFLPLRVIYMICSFQELRHKEVINIKTGAKLGYIDDIEVNVETASVIALVVYGRPRLFGLLGRDDDIVIKCREIEVIGEDTILIKIEEPEKQTKRRWFSFENLYK
jgi:YlmC/YmxH family sporulation protein